MITGVGIGNLRSDHLDGVPSRSREYSAIGALVQA
jgi:hypothetical protein